MSSRYAQRMAVLSEKMPHEPASVIRVCIEAYFTQVSEEANLYQSSTVEPLHTSFTHHQTLKNAPDRDEEIPSLSESVGVDPKSSLINEPDRGLGSEDARPKTPRLPVGR